MLKRCYLCGLVILFIILFSGCDEDELGVYTLCSYQSNWKGNVCLTPSDDPYHDFWDIMTSGTDPDCANPTTSRRYLNPEVVIQTIIPVPGDPRKCWDDFDLVFFYGHHNTIVPPHPHDLFDYYNYEGGSWVDKSGYLDDIDWGHTAPYDYYPTRPITNANISPAAVTYLYNRYTSSLLGGAYDYGGGTRSWQEHWNDPVQTFSYGELGDLDLEWLILYGCQAVITANEDGSYNNLALRCFCPVSGRYHIIMGHYISYYTSYLKPLGGFASDLLNKVPIQCAYFDTDPIYNTSAIAAEKYPFPGWAASTMTNDKWRDPMGDNEDACVFTQRWIVPLGAEAFHVGAAPASQFNQGRESQDEKVLDMTKIKIDSPKIRTLLKSDYIKLRNPKTDYIPSGELPVLKLDSVNDDLCQNRLLDAAGKFLQEKNSKRKIKPSGGTFALETKNASCWINRSSVSYKLTRTSNCMVVPTKISHSEEAIQKALRYVGENQLVELIDGEEMDILFVSVVKNALSVVKSKINGKRKQKDTDRFEDPEKYKLVEEYKSDYYVGFGRRFKGVPIVGSELVIRLEGSGEAAMIRKNWRKVIEVEKTRAVIGEKSLRSIQELIIKNPGFCARYQKEKQPVSPEDIHILNTQCGYMEAPVNYSQESLRPGAVVLFKIEKNAEGYSQLVISLEENVDIDKLWGKAMIKR
jgi:hypothetical protein